MKGIVLSLMCLFAFEAKSQSIEHQRSKALKSYVMPKAEDFKIKVLVDSSSRISKHPLDQMPILLQKGAMATLVVESFDGMPNPLFMQEKKKNK